MSTKEQDLLAQGLQKGFAGGAIREGVQRADFSLESSHFESPDGEYHDEWNADRVGGGQELVRVGDKQYTRVYAGGTISEEELQKLGLTKKKVIGFLKHQILTNGEHIRLEENFEAQGEGEWERWNYSYKVIDQESEIPMTTGKEIIRYNDTLVFVHNFILCPVE